MLRSLRLLVMFSLLAVLFISARSMPELVDEHLHAGVARTELIVPPGHKMLAFPVREGGRVVDDRENEGTHDPITIRCLVLKEGDNSVALVSTDFGIITESFVSKVRDLVAPQVSIPPENIIIGATHTHHGPVVERGMASETTDEWRQYVVQSTVETIIDAERAVIPATLGAGRGYYDLNYNRRFLRLHEKNQQIQRNLERKYYGPADKELGVIRVDARDGRPLAVLFNYAMHPMVMGPRNRLLTADFPGAACRTIEQSIGQQVTAIYFNGAEGNQNPYPTELNQWDVMEEVGVELGRHVVDVYRSIETTNTSGLSVTNHRLTYKDRLQPERELSAPFTGIFLQDASLVSVPGELFVQPGLEYKRRSPFSTNFILGLTGGAIGYIPQIDAYPYGGYGVDPSSRRLGFGQVPAGFGERVWQGWLEMAYEQHDQNNR